MYRAACKESRIEFWKSKIDHICQICNHIFTKKNNLLAHIRTQHENKRYECEQCHYMFTRSNIYKNYSCKPSLRRKTSVSPPPAQRTSLQPLKLEDNIPPAQYSTRNWCGHYKCVLPGKAFCEACSHKGQECKQCHRLLPERFYSKQVDMCDSCTRIEALQGVVLTTTLAPNDSNNVDILQFLSDEQSNMASMLPDFLKEKKGMKWFHTLKITFIKYDENNESILAEPVLRSTIFLLSTLLNWRNKLHRLFKSYMQLLKNFRQRVVDGC